jgi:adenylylsulfate kinase-like enzyme
MRRDSKGLYQKARAGEIKNVVGIDIPMPSDPTWDWKISVPEVLQSPDVLANMIYEKVFR